MVATVELEGTSFHPSFPFADSVDKSSVDTRLADLLIQNLDAIWVRARLKSIFGIASAPEDARIEKSLSSYTFIAIRDSSEDDSIAIPFECFDDYGRTSLFFSPNEADLGLKASVARAFWQFVASAADLADFEDRAFHPGVGIWMSYGCKDG